MISMKPLVTYTGCVSLALFLSACGAKFDNAAKASSAPTPPAAAQQSSTLHEVVLSRAAFEQAGIHIEPAALTPVISTVSATGRIAPNEDRTFQVGAMVAGRIASINVQLGDAVTAGQVLLRMHTHEIHDTRAAYLIARDSVSQAQERLVLAQRIRDRARRLLQLEAMSKEQVEQAETEYLSARAGLDAARAKVEGERTHLADVLEIPIGADGMPEDVDTVPVRAPAAGIVIERKATPGTVANAGDPLITITDPGSLWVIANVIESDLSRVRAGQTAAIAVRAWPGRTFRGRVERLGETLDPVTRTLQVRIALPNRGGLLKPEMFADVRIVGAVTGAAITAPHDAVQDVEGKSVVFIQTSATRFTPRPIVAGPEANGRIQIASGLKAGDQMVTSGAFVLKSELLKSRMAEE